MKIITSESKDFRFQSQRFHVLLLTKHINCVSQTINSEVYSYMILVEKSLEIKMSMKFQVYELLTMMSVDRAISAYGPLARYVKLWVTHAPGMPGTFSPPLAG